MRHDVSTLQVLLIISTGDGSHVELDCEVLGVPSTAGYSRTRGCQEEWGQSLGCAAACFVLTEPRMLIHFM